MSPVIVGAGRLLNTRSVYTPRFDAAILLTTVASSPNEDMDFAPGHERPPVPRRQEQAGGGRASAWTDHSGVAPAVAFWSRDTHGSRSLVPLGHKRRAPHQGQHGSCRISQPVILSRMLAIDSASCRRTCPRAVPRPVVHRQLRSCQLKPAWSRREDKASFG